MVNLEALNHCKMSCLHAIWRLEMFSTGPDTPIYERSVDRVHFWSHGLKADPAVGLDPESTAHVNMTDLISSCSPLPFSDTSLLLFTTLI